MKWLKWALGEAGFRTLSITISKILGEVAVGFPHLVFSALVIGLGQTVSAASVLRYKRTHAFPNKYLVFGSALFGFGAFVNTLLAFTAFLYGAPVAPYVMITLLSIIPGTIVDRIWFKDAVSVLQIFGLAVAIVAGWLILKMPDLSELWRLPLWTWLGLANAVGLALNQGVTRWVKEVDPWVKNFWGGLTTFLCCLAMLLFLGETAWQTVTEPGFGAVLFWSLVISLVVIGIWSYNVIAYRDGAAIAPKHVVVNGAFLTGTTIVGFLLFNETLTAVQFLGMGTYLLAFFLVNKEVRGYFTSKKQ